MAHYLLLPLLVSAMMLLGCAPEGPTEGELEPGAEGGQGADVPEGVGLGPKGIALNGIALNGIALNGIALNGIALNGIALNGATLGGVALGGMTVEATVFHGVRADGSAMSGDDFVGVQVTGHLANGATKKFRIDARAQLGGANADVSAYDVTYWTGSGRKHLCGVGSDGQPVLAVPLAGTWNTQQGVPGGGAYSAAPGQFTFACRGAAIAKCVELGYKPWQGAGGSGATLQGHLEACTRALRADFCGDGQPFTVDGMSINLYDAVGVQNDEAGWGFEAEWTPAGARFVTPGPGRRFEQLGVVLPCLAQLESPAGGELGHFQSGTLLMTEYLH